MAAFVKPHETRASSIVQRWHVMDAQGKTLGRFCSEIAMLLQGKHNPIYVPHLDTGDFVVVVNADKVHVTGKKLEQKIYYRHSGYHGGLNEQKLSEVLKRNPIRVIRQAVKGMLPKNSLGRRMLSRLKIYNGESHPHASQVNAPPPKIKTRATVDKSAHEDQPAPKGKPAKTASDKPAPKGKPAKTASDKPAPKSKTAKTASDKPAPKPRKRQPKTQEADLQ